MTGTSLALCLPSGTVFMSVLLLVISLSYMPAVLLQASVQSDAESGFREMMRTWPMTGKVFTRNLLRSADVIAAAVFVLVGIPEALILSFVTHVVTPWEAAELWVCGLAAALAWSAFSVILHTAVPSGRGSAVQNWLQGGDLFHIHRLVCTECLRGGGGEYHSADAASGRHGCSAASGLCAGFTEMHAKE